MSNKDSLPSMSGDLTLPKKDEIKFADYKIFLRRFLKGVKEIFSKELRSLGV